MGGENGGVVYGGILNCVLLFSLCQTQWAAWEERKEDNVESSCVCAPAAKHGYAGQRGHG